MLGPEHDECRAGDVVLQWIENAPWNTDQPQYIQPIQGTEILRSNGNIGLCMGETDTFLEVWDGTQKLETCGRSYHHRLISYAPRKKFYTRT